jgi:hypothetical protein
LILLWQGKEPGSHFYMCWAAYDGNYRNSPTHTLAPPLYWSWNTVSYISSSGKGSSYKSCSV